MTIREKARNSCNAAADDTDKGRAASKYVGTDLYFQPCVMGLNFRRW